MDLRLVLAGVACASFGAGLGALLQMDGLTKSSATAPEVQQEGLAAQPLPWMSSAVVSPELVDMVHSLNRLSRDSGARMLVRDCESVPCVVHLSWADDSDLASESALELRLREEGWTVRGQATLVEDQGDGRWFSHFAAALWPAGTSPDARAKAAAADRIRGILRAATR